MKISDWHVMEDIETKKREYYYGDLEDFEEEIVDKVEIPYEHWNSHDTSEILGNFMEDANKTKILYIPNMILGVCNSERMSEEATTSFMKAFMNKMLERIG